MGSPPHGSAANGSGGAAPAAVAPTWMSSSRIPRRQCGGHWHRDYTALHKRIMAQALTKKGKKDLRLLTVQCEVFRECNGLGDVLMGVFSAFLVSLLQGRALIINHPMISAVFEPAHVDWRPAPEMTVVRPAKHIHVHGELLIRRSWGT